MDFNSFYKSYQKKKKLPLPSDINERVEASLSVQIHTTGARPAFETKKYGYIKPKGYDPRFDKIFATRILNRHPNENDLLYNWRLSVFAPVAKELYDRFLTMCRGTILQPNSFDISIDDNTQDYIKGNYIYDHLYRMIPFVLENPYAYMAVIEGDVNEKDETEALMPQIELIPAENLLMMDEESCAFKLKNKIIFLDRFVQVTVFNKEEITTTHNFKSRPLWDINNNFIEPFVAWADLLVRNMNDDEAMTKQYSYPIKQLVMPQCNADGCVGGTVTDMTDLEHPRKYSCKVCNGTGTMSMNPGDNYTISEETIYKNNGSMYDMAKFITPDIGIPKYHLDRWQVFYDRSEKSLNLNKKINATESGDAKREDRKDQYFYLMTISNFVFENFKHALQYVSAYLNYNQESGTFKDQEIVVIPPKQFDLMTDSDLVLEFAEMQNKTDDSQLLSELQYQVNRRLYRNDMVQLTINDILYYNDALYGISGAALKSKLLSGVYTTKDKLLHEKGYKILLQISREMTPEVFRNADVSNLVQRLEEKLTALMPADIYNEN